MVRKLSILIPVHNEAATVEELLRRVSNVPFPVERELIVVDDGSTDGSRQILSHTAQVGSIKLVVHETNRGKGAAIRTALRHATGDVVVIQDADLELDPNDLPGVLEPICSGETQVCYGSRFMNGVPSRIRRLPTYWANRILNAISNLLNGIKLTDFNTCYKMMTAEVLSRLSITQSGFAMEPEITAKLSRMGYRIVERPVRYEPRTVRDGKKIRCLDLLRYLVVMLRFRFFRFDDDDRGRRESRVPRPALGVRLSANAE